MKTALVTGGAIRLGAAICRHLAEKGFKLAIHFNSSASEAEKLADEIGNGSRLYGLDFAKTTDFTGLLQEVKSDFGSVDLLINNASLYTQKTISQVSSEDFEKTMAINFRAPFFLTQAYANMNDNGEIINIIDNKTGFNQYQYSIYLLSKKALLEYTRMSALEFSPGIKINGISPGVILPASVRSEEYLHWRRQGIPLGRQGNTENICQALDYILSSDFITGQVLTVDGGETLTNTGRNAADYNPAP